MRQTLFENGTSGFHTFRIPALLTLDSGVILAFAEGRRRSASDCGWIETVVRRSEDGGRTWGPVVAVAGGEGVTGNPCPVQHRPSGRVLLTLCRNNEDGPEPDIINGSAPRTVWLCHSDDDGVTWSAPRQITKEVKRANWTWYATGPGHGIQLPSGRLVVACDHALHASVVGEPAERGVELAETLYRSHLILSDDGGDTWRIGAVIDVEGMNESAVAGLGGDSVYVNSRWHLSPHRHGAWSEDGGETWSSLCGHPEQVDPVCQGSVLRVGSDLLVAQLCDLEWRRRLTLHRSSDSGRTWMVDRVIDEGRAAYSDLCRTAEGRLLCLYECGAEHPYERIDLVVL